jgi:uncharacterized protein (DUF4415 family)
MRVDPDVLDAFKATGHGWQSVFARRIHARRNALKKAVVLARVLAALRSRGRGWQIKVNALLRQAVASPAITLTRAQWVAFEKFILQNKPAFRRIAFGTRGEYEPGDIETEVQLQSDQVRGATGPRHWRP